MKDDNVAETDPTDRLPVQDFLRITVLVRRLVRRKLNSGYFGAAEDIEQKVLLALWQWRQRNRDRVLSPTELEKIAAVAAKRGVLLFYRENMRNKFPHVDRKDKAKDGEKEVRDIDDRIADKTAIFIGNTSIEAASLAKFLLHEIEELSFRGRYALLLQKSDLIAHLLTIEGCRLSKLASILNLSKDDFLDVLRRLPLSDQQIGELWLKQTGEPLTAKQVWQARCRARVKIKLALERLSKPNDQRS